MKIIALLPVKNEAWILPTYLSSMKQVADEIIAVDDDSSDNSAELIRSAGGIVLKGTDRLKSGWAEFNIRQILLEEGRRRGGTHFICLDADEAFTAPFSKSSRRLIGDMLPGEKYMMRWVTLWKSTSRERVDTVYKDYYKDFIFCDDQTAEYQYSFMHVARTPLVTDKKQDRIDPEIGAVLHYQYTAWDACQLKQAWLRCSELIKGDRSPYRINNRYKYSLDHPVVKTAVLPVAWINDVSHPTFLPTASDRWQYPLILEWFNTYSIEFFEPLQIWHVSELHNEFVKRTGREPRPKVLPEWLSVVIGWKNLVRNYLSLK